MKDIKMKFYFLIFLIAYFLTLSTVFSGCVRLTGGAGVWKQGADDEEPVVHSAGFDTAQLTAQD